MLGDSTSSYKEWHRIFIGLLCLTDDMSASQKIAVVTGASSGIGAATALLLAQNGYRVIAAARRRDRLQEVAGLHENIEAHVLDVTDQLSVDELLKSIAGFVPMMFGV